jgi:curved DNA-binding protein CbpA
MLVQRFLLRRCFTCGAPRPRLFFASAARLQSGDFYQLLGLSPSASQEEIKAAYRKAALQWHPDRQAGANNKAQAEEKFKLLSQAYTTLSSPEQRRLYDQGRAYTATGSGSRQQEWARRSWEQTQQRGPGQHRARPDSGFSQSEAERAFRDAFGSNLEELLRRAQQAQRASGRGSPIDELFRDIMRQAAGAGRGGPHVEVRDEVFTRPDGRRVRRRTRTTRTADGRVAAQQVDEQEDVGSRGYSSGSPAAPSGSTIAQVLRSVAAPFVAALASRATSFFLQYAADVLRVTFRLLVRRLLGR